MISRDFVDIRRQAICPSREVVPSTPLPASSRVLDRLFREVEELIKIHSDIVSWCGQVAAEMEQLLEVYCGIHALADGKSAGFAT